MSLNPVWRRGVFWGPLEGPMIFRDKEYFLDPHTKKNLGPGIPQVLFCCCWFFCCWWESWGVWICDLWILEVFWWVFSRWGFQSFLLIFTWSLGTCKTKLTCWLLFFRWVAARWGFPHQTVMNNSANWILSCSYPSSIDQNQWWGL